MMKYLVVKTTCSGIIEYGEMFDNKTDAIEQAAKLNQIAKEDKADAIQFTVLPCVVMPKVKVAN